MSYRDLLKESSEVSRTLSESIGSSSGQRVAFLMPNDHNYVCVQWGIWHSEGVAVPLYYRHPVSEMQYFVEDSKASAIVTHPSLKHKAEEIATNLEIPMIEYENDLTLTSNLDWKPSGEKHIDIDANAMIIYTSGTTGRPKGVVSTHETIQAQILSLVTSWEWQSSDRILHFLPLHHVHGVVNKLLCALWSGATVEFSANGAEAAGLWRRLGDTTQSDLTLFMAVPTIYSKMLEAYETLSEEEKKAGIEGMKKLRLMVSGSAACPAPLMERWESLTGQKLLERYGMTEIGMALSNPYRGERQPGHVGTALPGVSVRIVDQDTDEEIDIKTGEQGELRIRGKNVFKEYWGRPEATAKEFDNEGWFKTGDIAKFDPEVDSYVICGRASADIIKTGGYKISALEIEREILSDIRVAEAVVVGKKDSTWGETAVCVIRFRDQKSFFSLEELKEFLQTRLASYKIPRELIVVEEIPKNAMGKVNKKTLLQSLN
eukprot:CAMPEP_0167756752 /NCGR_PEP_ID=MMETSP0110_2-20121227/9556_1 /TAXON_ID=629695 /ORGANISM="Gymnochlora sp., Strain CCMP2014" /LENGTH=487 /DNA_ID=CAMNT_0007642889 /DNA_START=102 /DNA_END=1565 /DNA_ORIENTATION=+